MENQRIPLEKGEQINVERQGYWSGKFLRPIEWHGPWGLAVCKQNIDIATKRQSNAPAKEHSAFMAPNHQKTSLRIWGSFFPAPSPLGIFRDGSGTRNMEANVHREDSWLVFLCS